MTEEEKKFPDAEKMVRKSFLDDISIHDERDLRPEFQTLGKFKILDMIGKGAAADVYLAEDTLINRRVALKVLTRSHPQDFERFKRESKVAAKLNHPNIIQLYEVGELQGYNYISMQYIEGGSLLGKNIPIVQSLKVIATIARAVEYAHNQGVIHRDIKPANILLDHEGKCYLADFGIAKSLTLQSVGKTLSVTGMIIGTPNFMSPEQARGDLSKVDFLSDVYSLGATLYYLITGKEPYQGTSVMEIINKVINEEAPPPRSIKKDIPAEVDAIALKAIEKDRTHRYQRAVDLAKDIERFLRGEPVEARVTSLTSKIRKRIKKYKTSIVIGAAVCMPLLLLGIFFLIQQFNFKNYKSLADNHFAKNELDLAYEYYMKCLAIKEDNEIRSRISIINDKKQRQSRAQDRLGKALMLYDKYKKILYDKTIGIQEIRSITTELIKYLTEAIQEYPLAYAYYYRGKIYRELAESENAEKDLTEAINLNKKLDLARLERIKLYWDIYSSFATNGLAVHSMQEAKKIMYDKIKSDLNEINFTNLPKYEDEIVKTIAEMSDILHHKHAKKDYYIFTQDLELAYEETRDEEFYYLIGLSSMWMKDYKKAIEVLTKATDKRPFYPKAYLVRGDAISFSGNYKEAIDNYTIAITQAPGYTSAYWHRASEYLRIGEYEKAELDYKQLLKIGASGQEHIIYSILGKIYSDKNLLDDALQCFTKALDINNRYANAMVYRSIVYLKKGDRAKALIDVNNAIAIEPENAAGYYVRGGLYLSHLNQPSAALDDLNRAIQLWGSYKGIDVKLEHLFLLRGTAYFKLGQYDDAMKDCDEALKLNPSSDFEEKQVRPLRDKIKELKPDK